MGTYLYELVGRNKTAEICVITNDRMTAKIGERLRLARLGKGVSLEQASRETFIKEHYLQLPETPSALHARRSGSR